MTMLLIDIPHLICLFTPPVLLFFTISKKLLYTLIILYLLVPFHWNFTDDTCILTYLSKKGGGLETTTTNNEFSEVWLRWLYEPILKLFNLEWNDKNLTGIVVSHVYLNIILLLIKSYFIC